MGTALSAFGNDARKEDIFSIITLVDRNGIEHSYEKKIREEYDPEKLKLLHSEIIKLIEQKLEGNAKDAQDVQKIIEQKLKKEEPITDAVLSIYGNDASKKLIFNIISRIDEKGIEDSFKDKIKKEENPIKLNDLYEKLVDLLFEHKSSISFKNAQDIQMIIEQTLN